MSTPLQKRRIGSAGGIEVLRVLVLGDSGVGKSSILTQLTSHVFTPQYTATVGVEQKLHAVTVDGSGVQLQVWDTAGNASLSTITSGHYQSADAVMIVFSVTDRSSFDHVPEWLAEIGRFRQGVHRMAHVMLVGNKSDTPAEGRRVTSEEAHTFADGAGLSYVETSAASGANVLFAFTSLVHDARDKDNIRVVKGSTLHRLRTGESVVSPDSPAPEPEKLSGWGSLAAAVKSTLTGGRDALSTTAHRVTQARVITLLWKSPHERKHVDNKFLQTYFAANAHEWDFFRSKPPPFFREFASVAGVKRFEADAAVFSEGDRATCMYVVLEGSVSLYSRANLDDRDDGGDAVPLDWSVVRHRLEAVQDSLNAIKQLAHVPQARAVKKGTQPSANTTPLASPTANASGASVGFKFGAGIVADDAMTPGNAGSVIVRTADACVIDTRQTWGRLLGGVKLAGVLANVSEEFEKAVHHKKGVASSRSGNVFMGSVGTGQSFGDQGLTDRRPVRSCTAIAKKPCTLIVLEREAFLKFHEANLMNDVDVGELVLFTALPWLKTVSSDTVHRLLSQLKTVELPMGEIVVKEGELTSSMYVIKEGEVMVSVIAEETQPVAGGDGTRTVLKPYNLGVIGRGQWFGERTLLTGERSDFTYSTASRVVVYEFTQRLFNQLRKHISGPLLAELTAKLEHRTRRLQELLTVAESLHPPPRKSPSKDEIWKALHGKPTQFSATHTMAGRRLQLRRPSDTLADMRLEDSQPLVPSSMTSSDHHHSDSVSASVLASPIRSVDVGSSVATTLSSPPPHHHHMPSSSMSLMEGSFVLGSPPHAPSLPADVSALNDYFDTLMSGHHEDDGGRAPVKEHVQSGSFRLNVVTSPSTFTSTVGHSASTVLASQVQPLQQFLSPISAIPTHSFRPHSTKLLSASVTRFKLPEFRSPTVKIARGTQSRRRNGDGVDGGASLASPDASGKGMRGKLRSSTSQPSSILNLKQEVKPGSRHSSRATDIDAFPSLDSPGSHRLGTAEPRRKRMNTLDEL